MRLLEERREVSPAAVARELGSSIRTVYRDLAVLERIGAPLYQESDRGRIRWRVHEGYRARRSVGLTWSEMLALLAGRELLRGLQGTVLDTEAASALAKVRAALPEPLARRAMELGRHVSASLGAQRDYSQQGDALSSIRAALERSETMRLTYRKSGDRRTAERLVDPYHLHIQGSAVYLVGYCHARRAMRVFALGRIAAVASTGQTFERRADVDPVALVQAGVGVWSGPAEHVSLRFSGSAADYMAERRLHRSQVTQWRHDGSLDVELHVPLSPPFVSFLVSFGPRVRVMRPQRLQVLVRREHQEALRSSVGEKVRGS